MIAKGNNTDLDGWPTWGQLGSLPVRVQTIGGDGSSTITTYTDYSHVLPVTAILVLIFISILLIVFSIFACVRAKVCWSCCFGKTRYQRLDRTVF